MPKSVSVDELKEEIIQLKQMLSMIPQLNDLGNLASGLDITKQQAEILLLMYNAKNNWLSRSRIEYTISNNNENYNPKCVEVQISKLRKIIGRDCIETINGIGYKLTKVGIAKCKDVLEFQ